MWLGRAECSCTKKKEEERKKNKEEEGEEEELVDSWIDSWIVSKTHYQGCCSVNI